MAADDDEIEAIKLAATEIVGFFRDFMQRIIGEMAAIGRWLLATLVLVNGAGAAAILSAPISRWAMPIAGFAFISGILCALGSAFLGLRIYKQLLSPMGALLGYYLTVVVDGERVEVFEKKLISDAEKAAADWRLNALSGLSVGLFVVGSIVTAFGLEAKSESVMGDKHEERTWTPQQIPPNVQGTKPRPDKEPAPTPPKQPEKK